MCIFATMKTKNLYTNIRLLMCNTLVANTLYPPQFLNRRKILTSTACVECSPAAIGYGLCWRALSCFTLRLIKL